jgi:hypothetical protein
VAVLLLFALVSGWLFQRNIEQERERSEASASSAWRPGASCMQRSLPGADERRSEQAQALLDWSQRLRLPLALDDAAGRRIATAPSFAASPGCRRRTPASRGGRGRRGAAPGRRMRRAVARRGARTAARRTPTVRRASRARAPERRPACWDRAPRGRAGPTAAAVRRPPSRGAGCVGWCCCSCAVAAGAYRSCGG